MWWQVPTMMCGVLALGFGLKAIAEFVIDVRDFIRAVHMCAYLNGDRPRP